MNGGDSDEAAQVPHDDLAMLREALATAGHDVVHIHDRGLDGHVDDDVLGLARKERRVLISANTDFGEILARSGAELPSLVLLRQGNRTVEHRAATLLANLPQVSDDLQAGAVVVLTDDRVRVRRLPLR